MQVDFSKIKFDEKISPAGITAGEGILFLNNSGRSTCSGAFCAFYCAAPHRQYNPQWPAPPQ